MKNLPRGDSAHQPGLKSASVNEFLPPAVESWVQVSIGQKCPEDQSCKCGQLSFSPTDGCQWCRKGLEVSGQGCDSDFRYECVGVRYFFCNKRGLRMGLTKLAASVDGCPSPILGAGVRE